MDAASGWENRGAAGRAVASSPLQRPPSHLFPTNGDR